MNKQFAELETILRSVLGARVTFKQVISKLDASRKDYKEDYINAYILPEKQKAREQVKALEQSSYERVSVLLKDLEALAIAKAQNLDYLKSPEWSGLLQTISMAGDKLNSDTVRVMVNQYAGNQAALRSLRDILQARVSYDGKISDLIYEPETAYENLREWAFSSLIQDGSVNSFATKLSKIAALEGIDFPATIDENGFNNSVRRGAGLPVN